MGEMVKKDSWDGFVKKVCHPEKRFGGSKNGRSFANAVIKSN
jgi:hypothetical protein